MGFEDQDKRAASNIVSRQLKYEETKALDNAESLLADHPLVMHRSSFRLWPIALGSVAVTLIIGAGISAYIERNRLYEEVESLSQQLVYSRKKVEGLILENAQLAKAYTNVNESVETISEATTSSSGVDASASLMENKIADLALRNAQLDSSTTRDIEPDSAAQFQEIAEESTLDLSSAASADWYVTVGAFSNPVNLEQLVANLRKDGYSLTIQSIIRAGRELQRVNITDLANKEVAEKTAQKIEESYNTGRLSIGKKGTDIDSILSAHKSPVKNNSESLAGLGANHSADPSIQSPKKKSLEVPNSSLVKEGGGWFIYVDTYTNSNTAKEVVTEIERSGFDGKIAVEYRDGNLFYRVQVVGIESREEGEEAIQTLADLGNMPRLQLRRY